MKTIRNPNNYSIYRQYDSRWGYLPYPELPTTVARAGCGCCAVTHCAIELDRYMDYTPKTIQPFMKRYAVKGHGTQWDGIIEGLKHYGMKNVKSFDDLSLFFKELDKGNRVGVILFGTNKAPDGRIFTTVGHYIAFVGYKKSDNGKKHYLYLKDSGGRMNDGWLCYETSMKGCIKKLWTAEIPEQQIVLPERGYFKLGDKAESVKTIQKFLKEQKLYKGKIGGKYWRLTQKAVRKFQEKYHKKYGLTVDGLWGKQCTAVYKIIKDK